MADANGLPSKAFKSALSDLSLPELRSHLNERAVAWDMLKVYSNFIDTKEKRRIEGLELFDEFEEWHMMQEHYSCVAYAINDAMGFISRFWLSLRPSCPIAWLNYRVRIP